MAEIIHSELKPHVIFISIQDCTFIIHYKGFIW